MRPNGIPYASFGLVWKTYGAELAGGAEVARRVDESLVQLIDGPDNGVNVASAVKTDIQPFEFSHALFSFNPTWKEPHVDADTQFFKAVDFAKQVITREVARAQASFEAIARVEKAYREAGDKRIIVLDEGYPWTKVIMKYPEPLYIVSPSSDRWHVRAVPIAEGSFENRKPLPQSWAGKTGVDLEKETGVVGAIFAHRGLFLASSASQIGAIALAKKALESVE